MQVCKNLLENWLELIFKNYYFFQKNSRNFQKWNNFCFWVFCQIYSVLVNVLHNVGKVQVWGFQKCAAIENWTTGCGVIEWNVCAKFYASDFTYLWIFKTRYLLGWVRSASADTLTFEGVNSFYKIGYILPQAFWL